MTNTGELSVHPPGCNCAECDRAGIAEKIKTYGRYITAVITEPGVPLLTYTIGNHEIGLPELLTVGPPVTVVQNVINEISDRLAARQILSVGDVYLTDTAKAPVRLLDVTNEPIIKAKITCQVAVYYRTHDYRVTQILFPDPGGHFPGDSQCVRPYSRQLQRYRL